MKTLTEKSHEIEIIKDILKLFRILNYDLFESFKEDTKKIQKLNEIYSSFKEDTYFSKFSKLFKNLKEQDLIPVVIICDEHNELWKVPNLEGRFPSTLNLFRSWTGSLSGVSKIYLILSYFILLISNLIIYLFITC